MITKKIFLATWATVVAAPSLVSANDNFADAEVINYTGSPIAIAATTEGASTEANEMLHDGVGNQSVWYQFTPSTNTRLEVEITYEMGQASVLDAVLAIYNGTSLSDLQVVSRYSTLFVPATSRRGVAGRNDANEPLSPNAYLTLDVTAGTTYYIAVSGENNRGVFTLNLRPTRNTLQPLVELLPTQSMWRHLIAQDGGMPVDPNSQDPNLDFYSTWQRDSNYDGPTFAGPSMAPVGYNEVKNLINPGASNLWIMGSSEAPPSGQRYTAYLKTTFTPDQPVGGIGIEGVFDDGAIIYINGTEVTRINMPAGANPNDWQTLSQDQNLPEAPGTESELFIHYRNIAGLNLPAGQPVDIAVSLHNGSAGSSDMGMDLRIFGTAEGEPAPPPAIKARIEPEPEVGTFRLIWDATANTPYNIESSRTLKEDDWSVVNVNPIIRTMSGETFQTLTDASGKQFWRVVPAP